MSGKTEHVKVYEDEIRPWLPPQVLDCHVHICLPSHWGPISPDRLAKLWAIEVGDHQSWEEMMRNCSVLFPGIDLSVLAFGHPYREVDTAANNEYVLEGLRDPANRALGLLVTRPQWDADYVERQMRRGFIGIKPYPDLAESASDELSIYDYLPRGHLALMERLGGVVMLHLPRAKRIEDPDNIRELIEICETYPSVKLIVAHIGRAYCLPTAERGLPHLVGCGNLFFDTAANLNPDVFELAIGLFGVERILFGSDLPITMMRGIRSHVGSEYFNYTDGPYSWNTHRQPADVEAQYTYFLYQELRALIQALERLGFEADSMRRIAYTNSAELLRRAVSRPIR